MQIRENPPYKGGCPKIGLDRRGGMNQNTPNPYLLSGVPIIVLYPLNGEVEAVPRILTFDHGWYWTPRSGCRQGNEMGGAVILAVALWLTPEKSAWQWLWREQRHHNRLRAQSGRRNQREKTQSTPIPTCV